MKGISLRRALAGMATVAAVVIGGLALAGTVSAQDGDGVNISDGAAEVGSSDEVTLTATSISDPGLGAWTIDVSFDNSVISASSCTPEQGGVCNPNFADDTVRITGASASGLEGDSTLGTIEFECEAEGESDLTISLFTFADATIGAPTTIEDPAVTNGTFTCGGEGGGEPVAPPAAGTGFTPEGAGIGWLLLVLAYLGAAAMAVGALRWRTR